MSVNISFTQLFLTNFATSKLSDMIWQHFFFGQKLDFSLSWFLAKAAEQAQLFVVWLYAYTTHVQVLVEANWVSIFLI